MPTPHCPEHRSIVLDLLQGRLEGSEAHAAEDLLEGCPACRARHGELLSGAAAEAVERAVGEAFAAFAPPRRRVRPGWLRLAVAAALALGIGLALRWIAVDSRPDGSAAVRGELIVVLTNEAGSERSGQWSNLQIARMAEGADEPAVAAPASRDGGLIFSAGSDIDDLSAWSEPAELFRGGFEDGTTQVWTNSL